LSQGVTTGGRNTAPDAVTARLYRRAESKFNGG